MNGQDTRTTRGEISNMTKFRKWILALCCVALSTAVLAGPTFESVTFGKESTHCNAETAPLAIAPDGHAMFVVFNNMRIKVRSGTDHTRCDVTLKLAAPLDAPETVQMDVILQSLINGGASASATVEMLGHKQALNLDATKTKNGVFSQRVTANLPKGTQKFSKKISGKVGPTI
jgi:hypothetical protein